MTANRYVMAPSTVALFGGECNYPTAAKQKHVTEPFVASYYQRLFGGLTADKLPSVTQQPVVQYKGTLCLFEGGKYSYAREFWFFNTAMKNSTDTETQFGTYDGDRATALSFSGTVSGPGQVVGDTINVGSNQFVRAETLAPTCEALR
jgi:hypothetical protein